MITFERNVIGSLILDNSAIATVSGILCHSDFSSQDNAEIYRCIIDLNEAGAPCDVFSISDALGNEKYLTMANLAFISDIEEATASAANVEYHAEQVKDYGLKRKVKGLAAIAEDSDTGAEAVESALKELTTMATGTNKTSSHINDCLNDVIADVEGIFNNTTKYISSGLDQIDHLIHGFADGGLYVIAARPAMGKSVLALNIAAKTAREGIPTKIFSLEMPKKEVAYRMVCAAASMNTRAKYDMQDDDWSKLTAGFSKLKDQPIEVDDGAGYTISYLKNSIRTHHQKNGKSLYVIDYLQLIRIKGENRVTGIGEITRELKGLAKEIESPIILLSQLNRSLEQRPDKRPLMSDLRESGEIEQDADVIIMLYRDEVYNENTEAKGIAEAIIRKNRQGETGIAYLSSQLQFSRFNNLARQQ